ncbi:MAG: MsnO8 family LLM class oxidoreductase [Phenylobacterium sp.]
MPLLSVLDLSPASGDNTLAQAVRDTLEVARAAERLGYHRFWMAEHHNLEGLGSPAPEILIAALTQATSTIRLGSGGVMLVNYSPLKVAEVFMELEALAPGRIDLGVGRALGTDMRTGGALRSAGSPAFEQYFELLAAWLLDASGRAEMSASHPAHGIRAHPSGPSHPELFMLCSSADSAAWAGASGVGMVFAEFIARADGAPALAAYRQAFRPGPFRTTPWAGIATVALAADTAEAARRLDAPRRAAQLAMQLGERTRFRSIETAEAFLAPHAGSAALAAVEARSLTGDAPSVRRALEDKAAAAGADELFVMATGPDLASRIRSLELIKGG